MSILELKQQVSRLSQRERRELQAYLVRLKHDTPTARKGTAKTIRAMQKGKFTSLEELETKASSR